MTSPRRPSRDSIAGTRGSQRPRVIVAGGGVAALETLLALHALLGRRIELELLAPGTHFLNRPAAVAEPFGLGGAATTPVADVAAACTAPPSPEPADEHGSSRSTATARRRRGRVFAAATPRPTPSSRAAWRPSRRTSSRSDRAERGAIQLGLAVGAARREMLLTGGAPLYLRASDAAGVVRHARPRARRTAGVGSIRSRSSRPPRGPSPLYLAPYLATARPSDVAREPLTDLGHRPPGR